MGASVRVILMILAVFCFMLAAAEVKPPRGNFIGAGLALWALATLIG
jgi:hypothetical protein